MILRVHHDQWEMFAGALRSRTDVESAGIVLAERLRGGEVLLARRLAPIPSDGYLVRRIDQLRIDPVVLNRLIRPAREAGLSVLTVHTHPGTLHPWFSAADDSGDARLIPALLAQSDGPHGSIVLAGNTGLADGRTWDDAGVRSPLSIRVAGRRLEFLSEAPADRGLEPWFSRQQLALGEFGQTLLRQLHVAIVGLGGTGSVVFAQLAHLGVGHITIADGDAVEPSNLTRVIGATREDVGRTPKVTVAQRYAAALGLGTSVRSLDGYLGREVDPREIEGCDVLVSCVDRHTPRAVLNRLSYDRCIPLVDMGSAFRIDGDGRVAEGAGRVVLAGPGRPCLACWGHIDAHRLRIEAVAAGERSRLAEEGYVSGADVPQPSVIAFNTTIAGAAVVELLRLVTGFAGADEPPDRLAFDFRSGAVRRNRLPESTRCTICAPRGEQPNGDD